MAHSSKEYQREYMQDYNYKAKMSSLFLADQPTRELLKQLETLSKGSQFEKEAAEHYFEVAYRKANNLAVKETNSDKLLTICKVEIKEKMPTLSDKELDGMAKARLTAIEETAEQLAKRVASISDAFIQTYEKYALESFRKAFEAKFSDGKIDALIEERVSKHPETTQGALMEAIYGKAPITRSQLQSFLDRQKLSRKEVK